MVPAPLLPCHAVVDVADMIGSNDAPTTPPSDSPLLPCHAVVDVADMIGSNNAGNRAW